MGAVGVAWLAASFLPATRSLHQAVLVVSLVAFPAGRVRGLTRWLLACLAVPVGFGLLPQIGVAAVFALVALLVLIEGRRDIATGYPTVAAIAVAAVLLASWSVSRLRAEAFDPAHLLKERVSDIAVLVDAMRRVIEGECVIDPTIVYRLMSRRRPDSPLSDLTPREREILALMAEGRSNAGIAGELVVSERTVEAVSSQVFRKLGLEQSPDINRRVLAVLTLLRN